MTSYLYRGAAGHSLILNNHAPSPLMEARGMAGAPHAARDGHRDVVFEG
jgi:hypothetical protein